MPPFIAKLNGWRHRTKLACFDYDHTLVKPKSGLTHARNVDDWEWLRAGVPNVLADYYKRGYAIVVFTNQTKPWKKDQIVQVLTDTQLPVLLAIGFDKDDKKPSPTLFEAAIDKKWDAKSSFFAGDAGGRPNDWSDSDKVFSENVGITFKTPEEVFPFEKRAAPAIAAATGKELVIMTGFPGSGKSTIANALAAQGGHVVLEGDVLKTPARMLKETTKALAAGTSVVVDATHPSVAHRAAYIELAKANGAAARCIHVATSMEESLAHNEARAAETGHTVPKIVYYVYRKRFETPTEAEGCSVLVA
jgi:bifunctional polynucleotide phosphatase/kinase